MRLSIQPLAPRPQYSLLKIFYPRNTRKGTKVFIGCCFDGWDCKRKFGLVCCFLQLLAVSRQVLAVGSPLLNRQVTKDAKVGFMELSPVCECVSMLS